MHINVHYPVDIPILGFWSPHCWWIHPDLAGVPWDPLPLFRGHGWKAAGPCPSARWASLEATKQMVHEKIWSWEDVLYPLVICYIAIHRHRWFTHQKWWCSMVFCMFTRGYSSSQRLGVSTSVPSRQRGTGNVLYSMATHVQNHTWIFRKDYDLTWWRQNPIRWKWWSTMKFGATLFWDKSKYGEHQVKYFIVQYEVDVEITYI